NFYKFTQSRLSIFILNPERGQTLRKLMRRVYLFSFFIVFFKIAVVFQTITGPFISHIAIFLRFMAAQISVVSMETLSCPLYLVHLIPCCSFASPNFLSIV